MRPGAFAGALAGVIAPVAEIALFLVAFIVMLVIDALGTSNPLQNFLLGGIFRTLLLESSFNLISLIVLGIVVLRVIIGLGLGALGALIGRIFFEPPQAESEGYEISSNSARGVYQPTRYYIPGGQYAQQSGEDRSSDRR